MVYSEEFPEIKRQPLFHVLVALHRRMGAVPVAVKGKIVKIYPRFLSAEFLLKGT